MSSTTGTAGHPDVTEISDLAEGLLSPARTGDVRRHLEGCALCADAYDSLEEIRGLLGTLPGPPRMPDDIAGRIDAALAAEALLDATTPATAETVVHVSRETSRAAEHDSPADRPAGRPRGVTGPGRQSQVRPRRRRALVLGAVFTAAAIGLGTLLVQSLDGTPSDEPLQATKERAASELTFSAGTLEEQVEDLIGKGSSPESRSGSSEPSFHAQTDPEDTKPNAPMLKPSLRVPPCIRAGIGRSDDALGVEEGTYEGKNSYLVVLPHESDPMKVSAYVVDASCKAGSPGSKGKVLLTRSYAHP
ncbi:anti-sigma factor family protein [Streptomyces sp. NPDC002577]